MSRAGRFKFYEFFAGGGMARLGLGEGWDCLFANDFDPGKAAAYRANFADAADHFHEGDVWKLSAADLPGRPDLAWASSPCQDFSLAGARAGLSGGRSSAFFGFWRLVEGLALEGRAPRLLVLENVTGLLTSNGGDDFRALARALAGAGYSFGALEIDAAAFLPQSRPRVFVIAVQGAPPPGLVGEGAFRSSRIEQAAAGLPPDLAGRWIWWRLPAPGARNLDLAALLDPPGAGAWRSDQATAALVAQLSPAHRARLEVQPVGAVGAVFRRIRIEQGQRVQRAEVRFDGLAGCLRTPRGGSSRQLLLVRRPDGWASRLISPREAARLMGLPESYLLPPRATAAFQLTGDGVAAPVVRWLAEHLLEPLLTAPPARAAA